MRFINLYIGTDRVKTIRSSFDKCSNLWKMTAQNNHGNVKLRFPRRLGYFFYLRYYIQYTIILFILLFTINLLFCFKWSKYKQINNKIIYLMIHAGYKGRIIAEIFLHEPPTQVMYFSRNVPTFIYWLKFKVGNVK